jgi:hypothetical protein
MKWLQKVFAVCIREAWIVEVDFGNPGYAAEKDIFKAWLRCGSHRDCIAITAKARRNPEHIDFDEGWSITRRRVANHWAVPVCDFCGGDLGWRRL